MHQVVATDSAFAEMGIRSGTPGRDDNWRNSLPKKVKTLVEPGPQHRRWVPRIFSRTEDNNGVSRPRFLERCCADDPNARSEQKNNNARS
jgi:hypothetical protein